MPSFGACSYAHYIVFVDNSVLPEAAVRSDFVHFSFSFKFSVIIATVKKAPRKMSIF